MEASVIKNNNLSRFKVGDQTGLQPCIEDIGRAIPFKTKGAVESSAAESGDSGCSAGAIAWLFGVKPFTTRRPAPH